MTQPCRPTIWADLDERFLDLLCPLCSQVIHVGLRGRATHDAACRSAAHARAIVDEAEEDLATLNSYCQPAREPFHSRITQVTDQLRKSCLLGVPLSSSVRRPGIGWALNGPDHILTHWPSLVMSRAGLVPPGRSAVLRAMVELSWVRYDRLLIQRYDTLVQELSINEEVLMTHGYGVMGGAPEITPDRWHAPGALVTLLATQGGNLAAALDVVVLLSVNFIGRGATP